MRVEKELITIKIGTCFKLLLGKTTTFPFINNVVDYYIN
jgi:hypothetical protein